MNTHTVTHHPVRSDLPAASGPAEGQSRGIPTRWALAGLFSGLTGAAAIVCSLGVDAGYDESLNGDTAAIADALAGQTLQIAAFHVLGMVSAVLMIVFAAGLYRRLGATAPADSVAPLVAFSGLLGTAIVLVLGTGLDTEFLFGADDPAIVSPDNAAFFGHWIATIPWVWGLVGLSGIAVFAVARTGGVARWMGIVGLVGGGLTLLIGISPVQYLAGFTGPIGLIVVALGFLVGDKAYRRG